jgi:hypothetical protein
MTIQGDRQWGGYTSSCEYVYYGEGSGRFVFPRAAETTMARSRLEVTSGR